MLMEQANDFRNDLETYLGGLASPKITTLEEIMDFNLKHKEEELPPCINIQIHSWEICLLAKIL